MVLDAGLLRDYPHGDDLAHVLGYVGAVNAAEQAEDGDPLLQLPEFRIGKSGIERSYDRALRGRAGLSRVEVNALGREIRELDRREGEPGADVQLTLDLELQRFCVERLSSRARGQRRRARRAHRRRAGAGLGAELRPGRVRRRAAAAASGSELRDDPRTPLVNKCIRGQYPPGSTFKMMTALAALEAGVVAPTYQVFCPGFTSLGRARVPLLEGARPRPARAGRRRWASPATSTSTTWRGGSASTPSPPWRTASGSARRWASTCRASSRADPDHAPGRRRRAARAGRRARRWSAASARATSQATPLQLAVMAARLANGGRAVTPWLVRAAGPDAPAPEPIGVPQALAGRRACAACARWCTARAAPPAQAALGLPGDRDGRQDRHLAGAPHHRAERAGRAPQAQGHRPGSERDHALFVCFAPYRDAALRGRGGRRARR